MRADDFTTMSIEQLWALHDQLNCVLNSRMESKKRELESRLEKLVLGPVSSASGARPRLGTTKIKPVVPKSR